MFGKMMKKAGQAAGAVASNTRVDVGGVSVGLGGLASAAQRAVGTGAVADAYGVPHGFASRMTYELEAEDVQDISRPEPPAGLDPMAVQYADAWYSIWLRVRDGHVPVAQAAEARDFTGATSLLNQWRAQVQAAEAESQRLGPFNGAQTLMYASTSVSGTIDSLASGLEEFIGEVFGGNRDESEAIDLILRVIRIHVDMNRGLRQFYLDPTGAQVEAAIQADPAMQQMNAMMAQMRQVDESGPEFQPIAGITLHDWMAAGSAMQAGMNADQVCRALGVERPQWEQANLGWTDRLSQFPMTVGMKSQEYINAPHPAFGAGGAGGAGGALAGSQKERLASDWDFYIECNAAMQAVPEAGMDAEVYLEKNYRVTVAEVASAAWGWGQDPQTMSRIQTATDLKKREISASLQKEIGPGIADDIVF